MYLFNVTMATRMSQYQLHQPLNATVIRQ